MKDKEDTYGRSAHSSTSTFHFLEETSHNKRTTNANAHIAFCHWMMDNYYLEHGDWKQDKYTWKERDTPTRKFRSPEKFTTEELYLQWLQNTANNLRGLTE